MVDKDDKKDEVKVEPKMVTKPIRKPTALELERLAARQRLHEANVRSYLVGR